IDTQTGAVVSRLTPDNPNNEPFFNEGLGEFAVIQFSPDSQRLLTASFDRHVRVIQADFPASKLGSTPVEQWPISKELPFTPLRVWDVHGGRELFRVTGMRSEVNRASFSPDGRRILARSNSFENYCYVHPADGMVMASGGHRVADPNGAFIHIWDAANG